MVSVMMICHGDVMYVGVWIKAVYHAGRLQAGTKLWTCCGGGRQLSLQCNSWEDRERRQAQVHAHRQGGVERYKGGGGRKGG